MCSAWIGCFCSLPDPDADFARAGGRLRFHALVHPLAMFVLALFRLPAAEQAVVLFGIFEFLASGWPAAFV